MTIEEAIAFLAEKEYYAGFKNGKNYAGVIQILMTKENNNMAEMKAPEDAIRVIENALDFLAKAKVKVKHPKPVMRDRDGKMMADYTLKDWLAKVEEETMELADTLFWGGRINNKLSQISFSTYDTERVTEEAVDIITVLYSMLNQLGVTAEDIDKQIGKVNEKNKVRGYFIK